MERDIDGFVVATCAIALAYAVAAWARRSADGRWSWNVLVITRGVHARASLSNLQLFYFTLVVLWVVIAALTWTGRLAGLSGDVVMLLGVGAAGTAGGKIAAIAKKRLEFDNWVWLVRKGWIKESIEPGANTRKPEFGDLLSSGGEFDVSKFQLFVFSLAVGAALIYFAAYGADVQGGLSSFEIPGEYLSLIGLSQVAYIGGKAVKPGVKADLDKKLNELRTLETDFVKAVEKSWSAPGSSDARSLETARAAAPEEYRAYKMRAEEVASMVGVCTGNAVSGSSIEPTIPV